MEFDYGLPGLNPFFVRSAFKRWRALRIGCATSVSIPSSSGPRSNGLRSAKVHGIMRRLNPFFVRSAFKPRIVEVRQAPARLNPFFVRSAFKRV